jgi:hypothetical protein
MRTTDCSVIAWWSRGGSSTEIDVLSAIEQLNRKLVDAHVHLSRLQNVHSKQRTARILVPHRNLATSPYQPHVLINVHLTQRTAPPMRSEPLLHVQSSIRNGYQTHPLVFGFSVPRPRGILMRMSCVTPFDVAELSELYVRLIELAGIPIHKRESISSAHFSSQHCSNLGNISKVDKKCRHSQIGHSQIAIGTFKQWISDVCNDKTHNISQSSWQLLQCKDCPQHANGCDCGDFTLICCSFLSEGLPLNYQQQQIHVYRKLIAFSLRS